MESIIGLKRGEAIKCGDVCVGVGLLENLQR